MRLPSHGVLFCLSEQLHVSELVQSLVHDVPQDVGAQIDRSLNSAVLDEHLLLTGVQIFVGAISDGSLDVLSGEPVSVAGLNSTSLSVLSTLLCVQLNNVTVFML